VQTLLTLIDVAKFFPSRGKNGHISKNTVLNYTNKGVTVGERTIKLEPTWTPSGRRFTEAAVEAFLAAIKEAKEAQHRPAEVSSARAELVKRGVFKA
jgi:hypothetical protein